MFTYLKGKKVAVESFVENYEEENYVRAENTTPETSTQKNKPKDDYVHLAIKVAAVLAICGVAFYVYKHYNANKKDNVMSSSSSSQDNSHLSFRFY